MADHSDAHRNRKRRIEAMEYQLASPSLRATASANMHIDQAILADDLLFFPPADTATTMLEGYGDYFPGLGGEEKQGSSTAYSSSFVNVTAPSAVTDGTQSYVVVHKRTYSDNSNQTKESDNPLYSPPSHSSAEWSSGAEFAVDTEAMLQEALNAMSYDPKLFIPDMYNSIPQPVHNPYQQQGMMPYDTSMQQDGAQGYAMQSVHSQQTYSSASSPTKSRDEPEPPWSHAGPQRVPRYTPGFQAFESPGPMVEQEPEEFQYDSPTSVQTQQRRKSRVSEKQLRSPKTSFKSKEKSHGWEHLVVEKGGLLSMIESVDEARRQRNIGVRRGPLEKQKREKAARMRILGACWSCWVQKVPCSEGEICDKCKDKFKNKPEYSPSPSAHQLCCRSGFKDYETAFFPGYLHSHFSKQKIEDLINDHAHRFISTQVEVDVSTGRSFPPMKLIVNEFEPKNFELIGHYRLQADADQRQLKLIQKYSAPVGLMFLSTLEMKKKCREHIEDMIQCPMYAAQATAGDTTRVPHEILDIVLRYCSKDMQTVRSALMLHAMHYFMGALLTFSRESAAKLEQTVKSYGILNDPYLSSRLLNRQVKYVMHRVHREITGEVLEGLERSLRARTKDAWGQSFCTILILSLCIEGLQTAADIFVVCDIEKDGEFSQYTRNQSFDACIELDENPFQKSTQLFHDIYKSRRTGNGGAREGGFNPLRMVAAEEPNIGLDGPTERMVRGINRMLSNPSTYAELYEMAERPLMINLGEPVDPSDIKINNTGRLAAKFLVSF